MQVPSIPVVALEEKFAPYEITVEQETDGVLVLRRRTDGKAYRLQQYDEHVSGPQIHYACLRFGIEPFDLVYR